MNASQSTVSGAPARVELSPTELERLVAAVEASPASPQVGPYHLRDPIGTGGMGVVYRAEQSHPIQRTVALKLIKPGMDSREVIARFESERQALAMMNHRNVAKVLDAGTSDDGRPYFVMEYVPGSPITQYCDEHKYTIKQRLELFMQACEAVQHAHQKAIIHRDLKPSNILVTGENGDAEVKVIDFGVAKALSPSLERQHTLYTHAGQLLGTPDYMSPEQASSDGHGVDTRSDIYSLGVVLYELLTGALPFDPQTLRSSGVAEIQRMIREVDPPRPSTRLSTLGEAASEVASNRAMRLDTLHRELCGELEWIPLKAMRKEPEQRYATASELADDIRNYLDHRPLVAGPETRVYRLRKFIRRNKGPVAAVVALVATLALGLFVSLVGFAEAREARDLALLAEAQSSINEQLALNEALKSQQVAHFLKQMLEGVGPAVALGRDTTMLREILDKTAERVGEELGSHAEVEAELRTTLGGVYMSLGQPQLAHQMHSRALELRRSVHGADHVDVASSLAAMGSALEGIGRFKESEAALLEALTIQRKYLGGEHLDVATSLLGLAKVYHSLYSSLDRAEALHREALEIRVKLLGEQHADVALSLLEFGKLLRDLKRFDEAEQVHRRAVEILRNLYGDEHPDVADALNTLGAVLIRRGRPVEAEALHREVVAIRRKVLPENHPRLAWALQGVGAALESQNKLAEAEAHYREALSILKQSRGPFHLDTATMLHQLARVAGRGGRWEEAIELFREAVDIRERILGKESRITLVSAGALAQAISQQGDLATAESLYVDVIERSRRVLGEAHPDTVRRTGELSQLMWAQGRLGEGAVMKRKLIEIIRRHFNPDEAQLLWETIRLGALLQEMSEFYEAEALFRELLPVLRKQTPETTPPAQQHFLAIVLHHLAEVLHGRGEFDEARALAEEAMALYRAHPEWTQVERDHARQVLIKVLVACSEWEEARAAYRGYMDEVQARRPPKPLDQAAVLGFWTETLQAAGRIDEAEAPAREAWDLRREHGPDDWLTFFAQDRLGSILLTQRRYADAEPLLLAGYEGVRRRRDQIPPVRQSRVIEEALHRLIALYEQTDQPHEAARWREQLAAFSATQPATQPATAPTD